MPTPRTDNLTLDIGRGGTGSTAIRPAGRGRALINWRESDKGTPLIVTIVEGGNAVDLSGLRAYLKADAPGGFVEGGMTISGSTATYTLDDDLTSEAGRGSAYVELQDSAGTIVATTDRFQFEVDRAMDLSPGQATHYISELDELVAEAKEVIVELQTESAQALADIDEALDEWSDLALNIGEVDKGDEPAAAIRQNTSKVDLLLDLTLPKGDQGEPGEKGDKGDPGDVGATPDIEMEASVDNGSGTPVVYVDRSGTEENPTFTLRFYNLKGDPGADGTSITILGQYDTLEDLEAAHPTGELGDGYLLANGDLCVWDGTEWQDVGNIRGPVGATPDITFAATVDDAKCTEAGMPSVDVVQTGTDESPNVALAFHGLVGEDGDGFAWNILRGTNSGAALVRSSGSALWETGNWYGLSSYVTAIDISDAPIADIEHGFHCERESTGGASIWQYDIPVIAGNTYIMSCYARGDTCVQSNYNDGSNHWSSGNDTITDEWTQYKRVITPSADTIYVVFQIGSSTFTANGDICGMKLELAADPDDPRPTAWTPSPWDITPQLSMTASVDATSETPSVEVTQDTSGNATAFDLAFSGLHGKDGENGVGVPTGGATGALLAKASGSDYDTEWTNIIKSNTLTQQTSQWAQSQTPLDSQYYAPTLRFYDADSVRIGYFCGRYYNSTDSVGLSQYATRTIGGTEYTFGFTPNIDASGNLTLTFANTASMQAWQAALGINTLQATVAALADTTATLAAAHDADADAICALYVDLIHHDVRDIDSVPDAYRAQVTEMLTLDGDDWTDPYVDDDSDRAIAPSEPLPLSDDADAGE